MGLNGAKVHGWGSKGVGPVAQSACGTGGSQAGIHRPRPYAQASMCPCGPDATLLLAALHLLLQFYYLFGFLALVFLILIITCAEITIVLCYFQLCSEVRVACRALTAVAGRASGSCTPRCCVEQPRAWMELSFPCPASPTLHVVTGL